MSFTSADLQFFDFKSNVDVSYRKLPHWSQAGTICFITFRTNDSIPKAVLQDWIADRNFWLERHGIDVMDEDWREELSKLPFADRLEFRRTIGDQWLGKLDECHGDCVLRDPVLSEIVAKSLLHFDNDRYLMTDFVVMPNHVHLLAAFRSAEGLLSQCDSWKHFTAREINRAIGSSGRFWQQDGFDHLVRSEEEYFHLRRYILDNPIHTRLGQDQYRHYSAKLGSSVGTV
jgi:REP element-mobilizing transposase RayT